VNRRAVVTGGAGFIGSTLVDLLVDRSWDVLVVDDLRTGSMDNLTAARRRGKVSVHVMDVRAPELAEAATRYRPEVVFHLAAQTKVPASVADPVADADVNVLGTINVLEAARAAGARKVVFASSGGAVYGHRVKLPATERSARRPDSPYGISKKIVEDYFRWYADTHGVAYTMIGPANVYGPRQSPGLEGGVVAIFTAAMLEGRRPTIFGDGTQTRDYVYVEDVCDAFLRAADAGDGLFVNAGSGRETTVLELYEALARIVSFERRPLFEEPRPGDVPRSVLDSSRARSALGWEAWTELEDGLASTVAWHRRR
jgi:UDP-glucose 4-epimerase